VSDLGLIGTLGPAGTVGVGGRLDVNLTRRVTLETQLNWFPKSLPTGDRQGGQTLQLSLGVRGTFIRRRQFDVYGVVSPGFLHFTDTVAGYDNGSALIGGASRFALTSGYGAGFYPASRWTARVEFSETTYVTPGAEIARSAPGSNGAFLIISTPATVQTPWQVTAAVGYRAGRPRSDDSEQAVSGRWEVGPQFSYGVSTDAAGVGTALERNGGVGAFASYRLWPYVDVDVAVEGFLHQDSVHTPLDGGKVAQGFAGVKVGLRRDRVGVFMKVRPGVSTHSMAFGSLDSVSGTVTDARVTFALLDVGGVLEAYLRPRFLIRLDTGVVTSIFHPVTIVVDGEAIEQPAPRALARIQMVAGVGLKF
jgi:hypothetical protein